MLKTLKSTCVQARLHGFTTPFQSHLRYGSSQITSPLLRMVNSVGNLNPSLNKRVYFCTDSSDGSSVVMESKGVEEGAAEPDSKSSSAMVPTVFRPEDYLAVIALPLPHRPLFPGFYMPIYVKDPKLLAALVESRKRHAPYAGAFLIKDEPGTDSSVTSGSDTEKSIYELKGKELLDRLHEVGTLAQITSIQGDQVVLIGHRRLRITEMVSEDPLTVKIDHLKDKPYNKDDDVIKATSFEVISTLRDVLKTSSLWRDMFKLILSILEVLEELDVYKRLKLTLELVKKEMEISKIQESIAKAIEEKISGEQRRYLLNEQLKAIKKELGLEADDKTALSAKFRERLEPNKEKCPPHVLQVIDEELTKLQLLEASSSEFNVTRNYHDWLTALPWGSYSDENFDCGKTKRNFSRENHLSLWPSWSGTYIGAMPGKMVQCLKSVGTANPLVLIDEIDKLGRGHAGDPASAMLELLDPEQNANFLDHYLDVPIDLSKVLFVCTANVVEMIPNPLLDRMEIISIAGYITDEKTHIARDYLEKATREACGINPKQVEVTDAALLALIENYCREAGVRNLQKHIEKIYRKIALQLVRQGATCDPSTAAKLESKTDGTTVGVDEKVQEVVSEIAEEAEVVEVVQSNEKEDISINQVSDSKDHDETKLEPEVEETKPVEKVLVEESNLSDFVGKPVFHAERIYENTPVGVVMGLAWTSMGGSTLYIETTHVEEGEGKGALQLTGQLGDVMKESAQIAHTVARAILAAKEPGKSFFANTKLHLHVPAGAIPKDGPSAASEEGYINDWLAVRILPIGGVKEKTIAARRSQVKTLIFPAANKRDFDELASNVKEGLEAHFVDNYNQIFELAFEEKQKEQ
ncbi:hypothetical protein ACET3Z_018141 [Daucus carota]